MSDINIISKKELLFLKQYLKYNSKNGNFIWIKKPNSRIILNSIAGNDSQDGYKIIKLNYVFYQAHRLAWVFYYGLKNQPKLIDHKDGNGINNTIKNIRRSSNSHNQQNQRKAQKNNKSGYLGVMKLKSGKYTARINVNGKLIQLGMFDTALKASKCYIKNKRLLHKGCTI